MTVLHLGILSWSVASDRGQQTLREAAIAKQAAGTVSFSPGPPEPGWSLLLALMASLPAVYLGALIALLLRCGSDAGVLCCSIVLTPPFWYAIGRWLDANKGASQPSPQAHSRTWEIVRVVFRFFAVCIVLISALAVLNPHHRTVKRDFGLAILLVWSGSYLVCPYWTARRERLQVPSIH